MAWDEQTGRIKDLALRGAMVSMGFVFFSAAWRRFVNVPAKLAITSPKDVAGKLVAAAPGSPIAPAIHWLLDQPDLTNMAVYGMSVAEAAVGLGLIAGLFSRLAAAGSVLLNIALMLIFGWEGYECLDEWTMAALGFAISAGVMIYGPGAYSLDSLFGIDPFKRWMTRPVAVLLTAFVIVFTIGFYQYYFGFADLSRRTAIGRYRIVAERIAGKPNEARLYVNAGSPSGATLLQAIRFKLADGGSLTLPADKIKVLRSHFEPWAQSGMHVDGMIKLRLGSMTDIAIPKGAVSGVAELIDNPDQRLRFR